MSKYKKKKNAITAGIIGSLALIGGGVGGIIATIPETEAKNEEENEEENEELKWLNNIFSKMISNPNDKKISSYRLGNHQEIKEAKTEILKDKRYKNLPKIEEFINELNEIVKLKANKTILHNFKKLENDNNNFKNFEDLNQQFNDYHLSIGGEINLTSFINKIYKNMEQEGKYVGIKIIDNNNQIVYNQEAIGTENASKFSNLNEISYKDNFIIEFWFAEPSQALYWDNKIHDWIQINNHIKPKDIIKFKIQNNNLILINKNTKIQKKEENKNNKAISKIRINGSDDTERATISLNKDNQKFFVGYNYNSLHYSFIKLTSEEINNNIKKLKTELVKFYNIIAQTYGKEIVFKMLKTIIIDEKFTEQNPGIAGRAYYGHCSTICNSKIEIDTDYFTNAKYGLEIMSHEYGHILDYYFRQNKPFWVSQSISEEMIESIAHGTKIKNKNYKRLLTNGMVRSWYGNTNDTDLFAEAFSRWIVTPEENRDLGWEKLNNFFRIDLPEILNPNYENTIKINGYSNGKIKSKAIIGLNKNNKKFYIKNNIKLLDWDFSKEKYVGIKIIDNNNQIVYNQEAIGTENASKFSNLNEISYKDNFIIEFWFAEPSQALYWDNKIHDWIQINNHIKPKDIIKFKIQNNNLIISI